jgi:glycosyltransferase involved in cell wall biosynthesis
VHVGLNLVWLAEDSGGAGTYSRELVAGLADLGVAVTAWVSADAPVEALTIGGVNWVRVARPAGGVAARVWHQLAAIAWDARRREVELIHGPVGITPLVPGRPPAIVTVLDVIWIHHPHTLTARSRLAWRTLILHCARAARRVITISENAAADLAATLALDRAKIDVTPLGFRPPQGVVAGELPIALDSRPVVLCVAAKRSHKNQAALIEAAARITEVQLVLAGSSGPYELELRALAERLGVEVRFVGWVSEAQLEALYARADVFVLPSLQEGFGLPVLEAMGRGVPVACSNTSSLPEVAGGAALLFDPREPAQIADAIRRLLGDQALAARLRAAGAERSLRFSWERTARLTLQSYERALCTSG